MKKLQNDPNNLLKETVMSYRPNKARVRRINGLAASINPKLAKSDRARARARASFWVFCQRAARCAMQRAKTLGVPAAVHPNDVDKLLVDQGWRCAVSNLELVPTPPGGGRGRSHPFSPSLDRKVPALGYVPENLRVVCSIVNVAMSDWGEDALWQLVGAMHPRAPNRAAP